MIEYFEIGIYWYLFEIHMKFIWILIVITAFIFLLFNVNLVPTHAQSCSAASASTALASGGLISAPSLGISSRFGGNTSGVCIIDPKAAFAPFKIPSFNDLKSLYFDQAKSTVAKQTINGPATDSSLNFSSPNNLYDIKGDLTINTANGGTGNGIVFVEGNLNITGNYTYGTALSGTVFIVSGNVNISSSVTRVDAVIIAAGTICTAIDSNNACNLIVQTQPLVINGSLISLTNTSPIKFRRTLSNNTQPSEKINHQIKYLVILRNTVVSTIQKWSEISGTYIPGPTSAPQPTPTPTLIPTATPTSGPLPTATPTPTIITSCSVNPTFAVVGQNVTWTATVTNPVPGAVYYYVWTSNPNTWGGSGGSPSINQTYYTAGTYNGIVTVTDGKGNSSGLVSCGNLPVNNTTPTATPTPSGCKTITWYGDADKDGYGNPVISTIACTQPVGYVANASDCYDSNANAFPGQTQVFSSDRGDGSYDYNCDGQSTPTYTSAMGLYSCLATTNQTAYLISGKSCSSLGTFTQCTNVNLKGTAACGQLTTYTPGWYLDAACTNTNYWYAGFYQTCN